MCPLDSKRKSGLFSRLLTASNVDPAQQFGLRSCDIGRLAPQKKLAALPVYLGLEPPLSRSRPSDCAPMTSGLPRLADNFRASRIRDPRATSFAEAMR